MSLLTLHYLWSEFCGAGSHPCGLCTYKSDFSEENIDANMALDARCKLLSRLLFRSALAVKKSIVIVSIEKNGLRTLLPFPRVCQRAARALGSAGGRKTKNALFYCIYRLPALCISVEKVAEDKARRGSRGAGGSQKSRTSAWIVGWGSRRRRRERQLEETQSKERERLCVPLPPFAGDIPVPRGGSAAARQRAPSARTRSFRPHTGCAPRVLGVRQRAAGPLGQRRRCGAGVDEGQAGVNRFVVIAPCSHRHPQPDAVLLESHTADLLSRPVSVSAPGPALLENRGFCPNSAQKWL
jgi:hypothetical protein